jgi:L-fuculose-phosphate aldolase
VNETSLRADIILCAQRMNALRINRGTSGNVSARIEGGFLITPTALAYDALQVGDVVEMALGGESRGTRRPSSEWRFHRDIYAARSEVGAVVHAHSPFATTLSCLGRAIPAFHYMVAVAGGNDIRCAAYATFGTQQLSDHVLAAMQDRKACLMANHGMIAVGEALDDALALAVEVEALAEQYWRALQIGQPNLLCEDEMQRVLENFQTYRLKSI